MEEIQEIKQFLEHIQPRVGENAFYHVWQTVEELEEKLVKESDSLPCVRLSLPNRKELEERYDDWSKHNVSGIWRDDFKKLIFQFIDKFKSS